MKNEGRNKKGQFTKGHPGFKPEGAVSRKKKQQNQLLNRVFSILEKDLESGLDTFTPYQRMKIWLKLTSLVLPKLKRVPYEPEPEKEMPKKFTFEVVPSGSDDSSFTDNQ